MTLEYYGTPTAQFTQVEAADVGHKDGEGDHRLESKTQCPAAAPKMRQLQAFARIVSKRTDKEPMAL